MTLVRPEQGSDETMCPKLERSISFCPLQRRRLYLVDPLEVGVAGVENPAAVVDDRGCEVYRVRVPAGTVRVGGVSRRVGVGQRVHLGVDEDAVGGLGPV